MVQLQLLRAQVAILGSCWVLELVGHVPQTAERALRPLFVLFVMLGFIFWEVLAPQSVRLLPIASLTRRLRPAVRVIRVFT